MFADQVTKIKLLQAQIPLIEKSVRNLRNNVEKHVEQRLNEKFPGIKFEFYALVDVGYLTTDWKPEVYFNQVNDCELSGKGVWHNWYDQRVKPPVPTKKFLEFLKELSQELGMKCKMGRREPLKLKED